MEKYINIKDLNALLVRLSDEVYKSPECFYGDKEYVRGWCALCRRLSTEFNQLPCVEVAPAGYYEWLLVEQDDVYYHRCSCCGASYQVLPETTFEDIKKAIKHCPSCGATML